MNYKCVKTPKTNVKEIELTKFYLKIIYTIEYINTLLLVDLSSGGKILLEGVFGAKYPAITPTYKNVQNAGGPAARSINHNHTKQD
jgi:hypothetical protein